MKALDLAKVLALCLTTAWMAMACGDVSDESTMEESDATAVFEQLDAAVGKGDFLSNITILGDMLPGKQIGENLDKAGHFYGVYFKAEYLAGVGFVGRGGASSDSLTYSAFSNQGLELHLAVYGPVKGPGDIGRRLMVGDSRGVVNFRAPEDGVYLAVVATLDDPGKNGHFYLEMNCQADQSGEVCVTFDFPGGRSHLSEEWKQVSVGETHACALRGDGSVTCWGDNRYGNLDAPEGEWFVQVSAGGAQSCALTMDGSVRCWGTDRDGSTSAPFGRFIEVSAGRMHVCGVKADKTMVCWGDNGPFQAKKREGTFSSVSAGARHTCALTTDNTPSCWGDNSVGQRYPVYAEYKEITSGNKHTCALTLNENEVVCWGHADNAEHLIPEGPFAQLSAGLDVTCGVRFDGSVECWKARAGGALSIPPGQPEGTFKQVSVGQDHSCGITTSNELQCWSNNPRLPVAEELLAAP